jgi:hypothetical protein
MPHDSDRFVDFRVWLQYGAENVLSLPTINSYVSNVRKVITGAPSLDQAGIDLFFTQTLNDDPLRFSNYKTAWTQFTNYARDRKGIELPVPAKRKTLEKRLQVSKGAPSFEEAAPDALPSDVLRVVYAMIKNFKLREHQIESITWDCVKPVNSKQSAQGYFVQIPNMKFGVRLTEAQHTILKNYAQPKTKFEPLVPASPSSEVPCSAFWLKLWIRALRASGAMQEGSAEPIAACVTQAPRPIERRDGRAPGEPTMTVAERIAMLREKALRASEGANVPEGGFTFDGQPLVGQNPFFEQGIERFDDRALPHLQDAEDFSELGGSAEFIDDLEDRATKPGIRVIRDHFREVYETPDVEFDESDGRFEFP